VSEEEQKQHMRLEIIRSFLDGERIYVGLLDSLVQVSEYTHVMSFLTRNIWWPGNY